MKKFTTLQLTRAAIIAALYATLTVVLDFIIPQYGAIQVRLAECLTVLPLFFAEAIPGVAIGCLIANLFGFGAFDIVVGTLTTLAAAVLTRLLKKIHWGVLPPIILNAIYVPFLLVWAKVLPADGYWLEFLFVAIGQTIAIVGLGVPLYFTLKRLQRKIPVLQEVREKPVDSGQGTVDS